MKPTGGIGAGTVERHHELIRHALHKIEDQCALEGVPISKQQVLSEAVMVHNSLLNVHGFSPFNALTGRHPNLLPNFDELMTPQKAEGEDGTTSGHQRSPDRLREIAINAMIEGTQKDRIQRALRSKARVAGEALQLTLGCQVGF